MKEYLDQYKKSLTDAIWAIEEPEFAKAVEILRQAWFDDKQVFIMGNGGSAGTANHFVCDFGKNAVQDPKKRRFRVLSVCDNIEKVTALGNDFRYFQLPAGQPDERRRRADCRIRLGQFARFGARMRVCGAKARAHHHALGL